METYKFFKYLKEVEGRDIPNIVEWKLNIELYYEDKTLIKDDEVLEILDKAYDWLYDFLTDDLSNLEKRKVESKYYDYIYYKGGKPILAYDEKNRINSIDYHNFWLKFKSYVSDYITDYETLILIIHGYLVNTLQMKGTHTIGYHNMYLLIL